MSINPYKSPVLDPRALSRRGNRSARRHPMVVAFMSMVLGAACGIVSGATIGGPLFIAFEIVDVQMAHNAISGYDPMNDLDPVMAGPFGALLGGFAGVMTWLWLGAILGLVAAGATDRSRRLLQLAAALFSGILGGVLGGLMSIPASRHLWGGPWWLVGGGGLGLAVGALGGWLLGKGIGNLAWGPIARKAASSAEKVAAP